MIYFIQAGEDGPIKIGKSDNPWERLNTLQTSTHERLNLRAYLDAPDETERYYHKILNGCKVRGEWFDSKEMIVNFAMACALAGHVWKPFEESLDGKGDARRWLQLYKRELKAKEALKRAELARAALHESEREKSLSKVSITGGTYAERQIRMRKVRIIDASKRAKVLGDDNKTVGIKSVPE